MNIKIVNLLAVACAALLFVIFLEWVANSYTQSRLLAPADSSNPKQLPLEEVPAIDLAEKPEESYADLVSRPLFIRGRRPVETPPPVQQSALLGSGVFDWQLNGVYTKRKDLSALFSRAKTTVAKDNFRKLNQNDDLDGWKLTEIHADKVILKQGNEIKELLLRKAKPKTLPKTSNNVNSPAKSQNSIQESSPSDEPLPPDTEPPPDPDMDAFENSDEE